MDDPAEPVGGGGRLVGRVLLVLGSSVLSVTILGLLFAWIALRVPWTVPAPQDLAAPSEVLARDGTVLARFTGEVDRRPVGLARVSRAARDAVVAAEDERFYSHRGVDPLALMRAVVANVRTGGIAQGGSTLTQQYVKKAFVGSERTLMRKVREAVISLRLERQRSKQHILERYLNTVYFGEGAHGIEAAALTYYDKPAARLTPAEGAMLAQLLPAPSERNPRVDPTGARQRRDRVLDAMERLGMITAGQAAAARSTPVHATERRPRDVTAPYFVEYVRKQLVDAYGRRRLLTGGLTVRTTLDLRVHRQLREAVRDQLLEALPEGSDVDAGVAAVDPATGDVLGIYGGRSYQRRQFDNATQLHVRQAGSGFKPFVYATALREGIGPDERYPAPAAVRPTDCPPGPDGSNPFREPVSNASGAGYGSLPLQRALELSVNTVFVQVGCDVGPRDVVTTARRMGVRNVLEPTADISIGGGPAGPSPLDMASAFGTLANDGRSCPARSVLSVTTPDGRELDPPVEHTTAPGTASRPRPLPADLLSTREDGLAGQDRGRCRQVIDRQTARHTTAALRTVVAETTATRARIDRPQAGKTGTTDDQADAWFTGYTPDLSVSVWMGHTTDDRPLEDVAGFGRVYGGTVPALIWRDAAHDVLAGTPPSEFPEPGALSGTRSVVGPARQRPEPPPSPSPTPTTPAPTTPPTTAPPATPTPGTTDEPPDDPDEGEDCLLGLGC